MRYSPSSSFPTWSETFSCKPTCRLCTSAADSSGNGKSPRGLLSHTLTYTLAFVPALVWLADDIGVLAALGAALLIALPHMVQDDGRLLDAYMRRVKGVEPKPGGLLIAVDQSWHVLALFLVALLVGNLSR